MHGRMSRIVNAQLQFKRSETDLLTGSTTSTLPFEYRRSSSTRTHQKLIQEQNHLTELAEMRDCFCIIRPEPQTGPGRQAQVLADRTSKKLSAARSTVAIISLSLLIIRFYTNAERWLWLGTKPAGVGRVYGSNPAPMQRTLPANGRAQELAVHETLLFVLHDLHDHVQPGVFKSSNSYKGVKPYEFI